MDVSREIILPVDRDTAWDAVCDLDRWLTEEGSELDLEPGAEGELTLAGGEVRWATRRGGHAARAAVVLVARATARWRRSSS